jgi:anti-anti-sigma factor
MAQQYEISRHTTGDTITICIAGEIDYAVHEEVHRVLISAATAEQIREVVLDLDLLKFVDSTCIGVLIAGHDAATTAGRGFRIINPCGTVSRVLTSPECRPCSSTTPAQPTDQARGPATPTATHSATPRESSMKETLRGNQLP